MILDSIALGIEKPQDFTIYLTHKIPSHLTKVGLKSVTMYHGVDVLKVFQNNSCDAPRFAYKGIYVRSDIINTDDNLFNNEKSDALKIVHYTNHIYKKSIFNSFEKCIYKNIKSTGVTSIRMYLTDCGNIPLDPGGQFGITYELEFI